MKSFTSLVLGISLVVPCSLLSSSVVAAADAPFGGAPAASKPVAGKPVAGKPVGGSAAAAAPQAPAAAAFELEADGVAFGMTSDQVARLYDRWWDRHFIAKYRKANPGPKTRELDYQLEEQKKILRRVAKFDGLTSTYDKADFREEFAHGNAEAMSSTKVLRRGGATESAAKAVGYTRRFFFFQDKLWKVYDEYRLEPQGPLGASFKDATDRIAASLAPNAKRTRGPTSPWESVLFDTGTSRVRVIKLAADRVAVVRADNVLAKTVLDARVKNAPVAKPALDEDTQAALR
ncbi:MAG: hypothetical protein RL685_4366 [Pseudomonadota bacterium]|jgi:hypothetical protein